MLKCSNVKKIIICYHLTFSSVVKVDHETRRYSNSTIHRTQSIRIWKPPTRADDQPERLYDQPVLCTG